MTMHAHSKDHLPHKAKVRFLMRWLIYLPCLSELHICHGNFKRRRVSRRVTLKGQNLPILPRRRTVIEPLHVKTNIMTFAPSEDSDQPGHSPSLIRSSLSAWRKFGSLATYKAHSEDWSDWADAQADLKLRLAHESFGWFCHAQAQLSIHQQPKAN